MNAHQVGKAGQHCVAAEIYRRGGYAELAAGRYTRMTAESGDRSKTIEIQVKSRRSGDWHASAEYAHETPGAGEKGRFWIFVDLAQQLPEYHVMHETWILEAIETDYGAYLERHGGARPRNPDSTHHKIRVERIARWRDRWDQLGIFDPG